MESHWAEQEERENRQVMGDVELFTPLLCTIEACPSELVSSM